MPHILHPDFTWPRPTQAIIADKTPPTPSNPHPATRRFWGLVHRLLALFSWYYTSWFGLCHDGPIMQLPFGLILKWSDRTDVGEVVAMQMARAAGMPVPRLLCWGEHPNDWRRISMLMTRLPGFPLANSWDPLEADRDEGPWLDDLKRCLHTMRTWKSPFNETRICSAAGTWISTQRVPGHRMGPVECERELHEYL